MIPADTSKPLQEFTYKTKAATTKSPSVVGGGDALFEHLKNAFSADSDKVDLGLLQDHGTTQLSDGGGGGGDTKDDLLSKISQDTLKQVAKQGHVETFTLVHPIPSNNFLGINIYLDEVGMLKRLPVNSRASDYARRAGFEPPPQFYGDVYMGRVHKRNGVVVRNMSFRLGLDTAFDAEWLQRATTENLEYQMEMNRITGRTNETQPAWVGTDGGSQQEEGYSWTQTEEELEIVVSLPSTNATSKDISVKFKPKSIQVSYQGTSLASVDLFDRVDVDGCTWTLDKKSDAATVIATMEKADEALWPRLKN